MICQRNACTTHQNGPFSAVIRGIVAALALTLLNVGGAAAQTGKPVSPPRGFSEADIQDVFRRLDEDSDGKVTRGEYDGRKVFAIYRNAPADDSLGSGDVSFEQTKLSREFFDSADSDHDGKLSPVEILRTFQYERVVTDGKGYFTRDELRVFMKQISR
jgi:Ca2+-binding EF-hand superfamily protein